MLPAFSAFLNRIRPCAHLLESYIPLECDHLIVGPKLASLSSCLSIAYGGGVTWPVRFSINTASFICRSQQRSPFVLHQTYRFQTDRAVRVQLLASLMLRKVVTEAFRRDRRLSLFDGYFGDMFEAFPPSRE